MPPAIRFSKGSNMTAAISAAPSPLPDVAFAPGRRVCEGIEWIDFSAVPKRTRLALRPETPHRLRFNAFIAVTAPCLHEADFDILHLAPGDILLIRSGAVHAYAANAPLQGVGFAFTDNAALELAALLAVDPRFARRTSAKRCVLLRPAQSAAADALRTIDLLHAHLAHTPDPHVVRLLAAAALALGLSGDSRTAARSRSSALAAAEEGEHATVLSAHAAARFEQFIRLVEADGARGRSVSRYAALLGISPGRLNLLVKRAAGMSAKRWIDEALLLEALRLLATESRSIESIAIELGFTQATHFVKFFTRLKGMTPGAFRSSLHR